MRLRILSGSDVSATVTMHEAVDVMREAFVALSSGDAVAPLRLALETPHGVHLFMPAHMRTAETAGAKVVSVNPENRSRGLPMIHAVVLVLDPTTGRPMALMDGTYLTALRTGAAGGLAADVMAREDASVVALFGAGVQARTQLEAVRCVRAVTEVRIVDPSPEAARALADELSGVRAEVMVDPEAALPGAHIIITATTSHTPVFDGAAVEPGAHVTGVGSFTPEMREVDTVLVKRARVFVDQREAALAEAGDLAGPIADGTWDESMILAELGEVVSGDRPGRTSDDDITFFKSVGNAVQDVAVATKILEVAERLGVGSVVEL
jgi:ornithine cyclodeaminase